MIHLFLPLSTDTQTPVRFTCPKCGKWQRFYNYPPKLCSGCSRNIPNVYNLSEFYKYRLIWHKEGI
jgi:hypothetical protein